MDDMNAHEQRRADEEHDRHERRGREERAALRAGLGALRRRYRNERHTRPPLAWGISLYPQLWAGRWCWAATTSAGETVRLTGALLVQTTENALWIEGVATYCIEDALGTLDADEPATHIRLSHLVQRAGGTELVTPVSLHVAVAGATPLRFYAPHRLDGWPL
jgi:hypothetical protein